MNLQSLKRKIEHFNFIYSLIYFLKKITKQMNKMYFKVLSIGVIMFALWSCGGNNNDAYQQQQAPVPATQQQPVQATPADSAIAQDPAQAQAAPATAVQGLPDAITTFIKQHFPNAQVVGVEPDRDHGGLEFDVYLNDGTQIDFDANNQWDQVESMKGVPAFFIPKGIANYVKSNYQNAVITKINKEYHGYEIELANGMELSFDRSGNFMGMDD